MSQHSQVNTTPFYGRTEDKSEISKRLRDPACRLLTLVGMGGMGKTRLVMEQMPALYADFPHGVITIHASHVRNLMSAMLYELELSGFEQDNNINKLANYLSDRKMLFILDGFENLLHEGEFLREIIGYTQHLKFLITSRQPLSIIEEWLYPLDGLSIPSVNDFSRADSFASVQIFLQHVSRIKYNFSLKDEWEGLVRLCHLLQGMPLALELAATWVNILSCNEIASKIEQNLDFLASNLGGIDERHQQIRGVLDYTWSSLSKREQNALLKLSIFHGDFTLHDAEKITNASVSDISNLVHKSMLSVQDNRNYVLHNLVQQFAYEKLAQDEEIYSQLHAQYCLYYVDQAEVYHQDMHSERQLQALNYFASNLPSIQQAWEWALVSDRWDIIERLLLPLDTYYRVQSMYEDQQDLIEAVLAKQDIPDALMPNVLIIKAQVLTNLNHNHDAQKTIQDALTRAADVNSPSVLLRAQVAAGNIEALLGNFQRATELYEQALSLARQHREYWLEGITLMQMASLNYSLAQYDDWSDNAEAALNIFRRFGDTLYRGRVLMLLGLVSTHLGKFQSAQQYFKQAVRIQKKTGNKISQASCILNWGYLYWVQEKFDHAETMHRTGLAIYRDLRLNNGDLGWANYHLAMTMLSQQRHHDANTFLERARDAMLRSNNPFGVVSVYALQTRIMLGQDNIVGAQHQLINALQIAQDLKSDIATLLSLEAAIDLFRADEQWKPAITLLEFVMMHPALHFPMQKRMRWLRNEILPELGEMQVQAAKMIANKYDLDQLVAVLLDRFEGRTTVKWWESAVETQTITIIDELLTQRELEVVESIADGLTTNQVAEHLFITVGTVRNHLKNIYRKLQVHSRVQLVERARELDFIE